VFCCVTIEPPLPFQYVAGKNIKYWDKKKYICETLSISKQAFRVIRNDVDNFIFNYALHFVAGMKCCCRVGRCFDLKAVQEQFKITTCLQGAVTNILNRLESSALQHHNSTCLELSLHRPRPSFCRDKIIIITSACYTFHQCSYDTQS